MSRTTPTDRPGSHATAPGETASRRRAQELLRPVALTAVVAAGALTAVGIWGDGSADADPSVAEFAVVCGMIAVAALGVFGWVVPRGLRRESTGGTALALSVAALVLLPAFWSGLPPVLGAGGVLLGFAGRDATERAGTSRAAVVVGALALVADLAVFALDWMSTNNVF